MTGFVDINELSPDRRAAVLYAIDEYIEQQIAQRFPELMALASVDPKGIRPAITLLRMLESYDLCSADNPYYDSPHYKEMREFVDRMWSSIKNKADASE